MAAAAALFAACSSNDLAEEKAPQTTQPTVEEQAVGFDAYVNRGLTRAGVNGPITTTNLTSESTPAGKSGFGVFGYYTDGERYSGITKPNFFYNQQVKYTTASGWTYTPVKYWPNEFGSDAISDQVDRVTLFAYLPWVEVDPLTGIAKPETKASPTTAEVNAKDPTTNITGMTRNNVTGDPYIKYVATLDMDNSVDLCYGVAANDFTSSNSAVNKNNIKKGQPYIDVVKPGIDTNSKIKFDFKHATAQLKVNVDAVVNTANQTGNKIEKEYTRIWVRSVTFEGITQKGSLNLNGGEWYDVNGTNKISSGSLTVFDGRKDGKEAMLEATNEIPSSLNPELVQSVAYTLNSSNEITSPAATGSSAIPGVTEVARNLFKGSTGNSVFVIPTGEKMKVTIVYDVETVDPNLAFYLSDGSTPGSTIENSISKTIDTFGDIKAGYCYTLNLHLGMRTVDFDAVVTDWQDMQAPVDLPSNVQAFAAANPETQSTVILPAGDAAYTYEFAVTGLNTNENVSKTVSSESWITASTNNPANGAGIAIQSITVEKNTTTENRQTANYSRWTGDASGKKAALLFKQLAAPIGFTSLTFQDKGTGNPDWLSITWTATDITTPSGFNTLASTGKGYIKVYRNGTDITTLCTFGSGAGGTIVLPCEAASKDVFKVVLKANDAPEESKEVVVP